MSKSSKLYRILTLAGLCCGLLWPLTQAPSSWGADLSYSAAANDLAQKLAAAFPSLNGYVLSTEAGFVYIDLGEKERVYPGMELHLYREGDPFTHPITGEVLGRLEKALGRVRVVEVRERFSIATQIAKVEDSAVVKGDRVRMTGARIPLALPTIEMIEAKGDEAKSLTRELALALTRTERFEVWEERRLLSELQADRVSEPVSFTDPRILEIMSQKLSIPILALGKVSGLYLDLQAFSTSTKSLLTVASAEIRPISVRPSTEVARPLFPEREIVRPIVPSESITASESALTPPGAWKGPKLEKALTALVVADVNDDREPELVVADKNQIMVYAIEAPGHRLLYTMPKEASINILSLDAADINGNGAAEIFATSYFQGRLNSFALEFRNGKFLKIWENISLLLRCLPTGPQGAYQLFGQSLGPPQQPWGKVRQYLWSGSSYQEGPVLNLPLPASLHGLAIMDIDGDGKREYIFLSQTNRLEIYGEDGKRRYRSSEEYGGTTLTLEVTPYSVSPSSATSPMNLPEAQKSESYYLQARLFPVPGKAQFYVSKNLESSLSILKGIRFFEKSKIYRLGWDGDALQAIWESKEFSNYMADYYQGDFDGDGAQEVAILLVDKKMVGEDTSTITIYKL
jgi:hypothetical protein